MKEYHYDGPVVKFNVCIQDRWKASTFALSEAKARNNLAYRYKKEHEMVPNTKITLPGRLILA